MARVGGTPSRERNCTDGFQAGGAQGASACRVSARASGGPPLGAVSLSRAGVQLKTKANMEPSNAETTMPTSTARVSLRRTARALLMLCNMPSASSVARGYAGALLPPSSNHARRPPLPRCFPAVRRPGVHVGDRACKQSDVHMPWLAASGRCTLPSAADERLCPTLLAVTWCMSCRNCC